MTFEEVCEALNALEPFTLKFGTSGQWRVGQRVEIGDGDFLTSVCGRGDTPESAVRDHWQKLVENLDENKWLVVDAMGKNRRDVRWNGFMWYDVPLPHKEAS